jgi:hypothetical protein
VPSPDLLAFAACLKPKTTAVWRWAGWRNNINLWKVQSVLSVTHVKRKKRIWKNLMKTNRHRTISTTSGILDSERTRICTSKLRKKYLLILINETQFKNI